MSEHYYSKKPKSRFIPIDLEVDIFGRKLKLHSGSGVFSKDELDKGTRLLIESAVIEEDSRILDLGCGYGVVGIAIAKEYPGTKIVMTDVNDRAVSLAKKNIKLHSLGGRITVVSGDIYEKVEGIFDSILVNPPQLAGKDICFAMIEGALPLLKKGGTLQLVARHNKGGKSYEEKMLEVFGNVKALAKKAGFRVYLSQKE